MEARLTGTAQDSVEERSFLTAEAKRLSRHQPDCGTELFCQHRVVLAA